MIFSSAKIFAPLGKPGNHFTWYCYPHMPFAHLPQTDVDDIVTTIAPGCDGMIWHVAVQQLTFGVVHVGIQCRDLQVTPICIECKIDGAGPEPPCLGNGGGNFVPLVQGMGYRAFLLRIPLPVLDDILTSQIRGNHFTLTRGAACRVKIYFHGFLVTSFTRGPDEPWKQSVQFGGPGTLLLFSVATPFHCSDLLPFHIEFLLQATTIQVWARDTGIHLVAKYYTIFCKVSHRKLRVLRCIGKPS